MKYFIPILILLPVLLFPGCSGNAVQENGSIEWVCENHEERMQMLLGSLNMDHPGMEEVGSAYRENNIAGACSALLDYYETSETVKWIMNSELRGKIWISLSRDTSGHITIPSASDKLSCDTVANDILQNIFNLKTDRAKLKTNDEGFVDWLDKGPYTDQEWAFNLNRHYFMVNLLEAWQETGNPVYSDKFNDLIVDWVLNNPPVDHLTQKACWRELETGRRLTAVWPLVYYGFQGSDEFTPAARLLMLSSIPDHTEYLMHFYKKYHNKSTTALYGLASAGCFWPEFRDAATWLDSAIVKMNVEIMHQVYADGTQIELTNGYHFSVAERFQALADMATFCEREVADGYIPRVESMIDYVVYSSTPEGNTVMNNDAGLRNIREDMDFFVEKYQRDDWRYILSNGSEGAEPEKTSVMYPWGGQLITRNGWGSDAHWGFFDAGPWGRAHQHHDASNICISAFGRDLLVDAGSYTYNINLTEGDKTWRSYFLGSESHNVILINGMGQFPNDSINKEPVPEADYNIGPDMDFARSAFSSGFCIPVGDRRIATRKFRELKDASKDIKHTRVMTYLKDRLWIVVDQVILDEPSKIEVLWHYHPDCTVENENLSVSSVDDGKGNLRIVPVSEMDWDLSQVRGQTEPYIQGWYSPSGKVKMPATTAVYSSTPKETSTFCWILIPGIGPVPGISTENLKIDNDNFSFVLNFQDEVYDISIPIRSGSPVIEKK